MYRKLLLCISLILVTAVMALAHEAGEPGSADKKKAPGDEAKELSGMSIVGNDEAPKSLYIVPWKSSEIGAETTLNMMLNESDIPVDRDVFMRQLEFYKISTEKQAPIN